MLMNVVRYGRRMIGATSEAYWAATLWNAPHGIPTRNLSLDRLQQTTRHQGLLPHNTSPATSTWMLGAKNRAKIVPIIMTKNPIVVIFDPYRSVIQPAMMRPTISPARAPLERPDCHAAETWYFSFSSFQWPYFSLKTCEA